MAEDYPQLGYGQLYNWYAVKKRVLIDGIFHWGLPPIGWHIATRDEYQSLITYLCSLYNPTFIKDGPWISGSPIGPYRYIGNTMKQSGNSKWWTPSAGTNLHGFNGVPGGVRQRSGEFYDVSYWAKGSSASYWAGPSTYLDTDPSYKQYSLKYDKDSFGYNGFFGGYANQGLSVRLVRDEIYPEETHYLPAIPLVDYIDDYDGNRYYMMSFGDYPGNRIWLNSDYKCTHYIDGTVIPFMWNDTDWTSDVNGARCSYGI
jgi:uncharacterized protein (TIGR02145 family)